MGEPTSVFVAYEDDSYDGCSEPLAVFAMRELAEIYLAGAAAAHVGRIKIKEMTVVGVPGPTHPQNTEGA